MATDQAVNVTFHVPANDWGKLKHIGLLGVPDRSPGIDKETVTRALEKLGPERVMRGHVALEHGSGGDWHNCFLALAYGKYGLLHARMYGRDSDTMSSSAGQQLGLDSLEVLAVMDAFDYCRPELQVLVEEWLELNYTPAVKA